MIQNTVDVTSLMRSSTLDVILRQIESTLDCLSKEGKRVEPIELDVNER